MKCPHNVLLSVHEILLGRKKQIWLYATTWMNFKNMLNKKKTLTLDITYFVVHL